MPDHPFQGDAAFGLAILHEWRSYVTGSIVAAVLGVVDLFGAQLPWSIALAVFIGGIVVAVYLAGRKEHHKRLELEKKMQPLLEIRGIGPMSNFCHRIMVHNLSPGRVRFLTKLVEVRPKIALPLPVLLQPTHGEPNAEAAVHGNGDQPVDVLVDMGHGRLELKFVGDPPGEFSINKKVRHELRICVDPIGDGAIPTFRWFYIVPQSDGSVIFTPNGSGQLA